MAAVVDEIPLRVVTWADEPERERLVKRRCRRCVAVIGAAAAESGWRQGVVSPAGIEHLTDSELTFCGIDATGPEWWWPL